MDQNQLSGEALFQRTVAASIAAKIPAQRAEEQEYGFSMLPLELRRVARLSPDHRRCFVLRVLMGLPREVCARMLQTEIQRIDELVCLSAQALASGRAISRWEYAVAISGNN
jgi:hypothetical protein